MNTMSWKMFLVILCAPCFVFGQVQSDSAKSTVTPVPADSDYVYVVEEGGDLYHSITCAIFSGQGCRERWDSVFCDVHAIPVNTFIQKTSLDGVVTVRPINSRTPKEMLLVEAKKLGYWRCRSCAVKD